jgi:hypothetical protein
MRTERVCLVRTPGKRNGFTRAYQEDFIAKSHCFRDTPPASSEMFQFFGFVNFHR